MDSVFNWVKAHIGIQRNETANPLAKEAATEDTEEIVYDKLRREFLLDSSPLCLYNDLGYLVSFQSKQLFLVFFNIS